MNNDGIPQGVLILKSAGGSVGYLPIGVLAKRSEIPGSGRGEAASIQQTVRATKRAKDRDR